MGKREHVVGAIIAAVTLAAVAFAVGRLSTTPWSIGEDACVEYSKIRAELVKAEREF
jgi:hypothetical protein